MLISARTRQSSGCKYTGAMLISARTRQSTPTQQILERLIQQEADNSHLRKKLKLEKPRPKLMLDKMQYYCLRLILVYLCEWPLAAFNTKGESSIPSPYSWLSCWVTYLCRWLLSRNHAL